MDRDTIIPLTFLRNPAQGPKRAPEGSPAGDQAAFLESERRVFERMAADDQEMLVLKEIAQVWAKHSKAYPYCAVMVANEAGDRLLLAAAPNLPAEFHVQRGSTTVSPDGDACGVAAWNKRSLIVEDIDRDPVWRDRGRAVLELGLQAGWAEPILSARGKLLGAFVAYASRPTRPGVEDAALMERMKHICRMVMEKFRAEQTIERMSNYDNLTNLPNRTLLLDHLDEALLSGARSGRSTALLLFNLDGMKQINDALGYESGDRFIKTLAARLRENLSEHRVFARVGGDEFGVVLEGISDEAALPETVRMLLESITHSLNIDEQELFVTASLGASVAPRDGTDADMLFKHADAALHLAKQQGRNGFQFFTADMGAAAARRLTLLGELRNALERDEFRVYYQPQMRLAGGGISGAEALLRWKHPVHGSVRPSEFIPLLEETGLIVPVGEWVLRRVCRDMAVLGEYGLAPPRVAVNLSARQFRQHDLAARIERIMEEEHMPAGRLTLEITESLLMSDPEGSVRTLQRLKAIGVHVALDDFGTGYSSLSYLKKFPIDELKIDKSFVDGVAHSREDAAIIDAAIHMAHNLGMQVVAEGVEDRQQWDFLKTHGCDHVQGYLTGKPLAFDGFLHRMRAGCVGAAILPRNDGATGAEPLR
jgi:diguanylate cyclase (GGDEF)-like protein